MTGALYHSLTGLHCLHVSVSMHGFEELVSVKRQRQALSTQTSNTLVSMFLLDSMIKVRT